MAMTPDAVFPSNAGIVNGETWKGEGDFENKNKRWWTTSQLDSIETHSGSTEILV
jgi:hypothetical protein